MMPELVRQPALLAGHFFQELEESPLAPRAETPIHWNALVAFVEALIIHAIVEIAPAHVLADRSHHIIKGLVEIEMVVFIE